MSDLPAAGAPQPTDGHGGLRVLALGAVALGVLLLAAAAFVLSYAGIHAVALSAGVSPRLARIYPLIFDAMLVVAGAAVLALRSAGLPSRGYAWLSMIALLATAAAADAVHATGARLPRRPAAATAAVLPWALVLIGFGLLLCLLRQARLRRAAVAATRPRLVPGPSGHVSVRRGVVSLPGPGAANGETPARPVPAPAAAPAGLASDLAIDAEPGPDDPASDEADPAEPAEEIARAPQARAGEPAGNLSPDRDRPAEAFSPAPTPVLAEDSVTETPPTGTVNGAETGREADDASRPTPEPAPQPEPAAAPETAPDPEPDAEAGSGPELEPSAPAGPEPTAGSAPHFDRVRSSPIPPDA
jgi:Protein of unknown function (DUF2637)